MLNDILTIAWKEFKEIFKQSGRMRGGVWGMLIFVLAFGVLIPVQTGPDWVNSAINLFYWAWVPYLLVISITADTFAGERERHTLETLLASRLSDQAILYGKLAASVGYGWGITLLTVLAGLVTANVAFGEGRLLFFPLNMAVGLLFIPLVVSLFGAGLGVIVSLRAATVRQASQTLSLVMFAIFIPMMLLPLLPAEWQLRAVQFLMQGNLNVNLIMTVGIVVVLLVDLVLLWVARARFQRTRLILD